MLKNKKIKYSAILLLLIFMFVAALVKSALALTLVERLAGRIVIQTESRGEAWYINPADNKRYYLGSPAQALEVLKRVGLGISNKDLQQIPIAETKPLPAVDKSITNAPMVNMTPLTSVASEKIIYVNEKIASTLLMNVRKGTKHTLIFVADKEGMTQGGIDFRDNLGRYIGLIKPGERKSVTLTFNRAYTFWPVSPDHKITFPYVIKVNAIK